jgi:exosome complex RNA-binding protein Rrp4
MTDLGPAGTTPGGQGERTCSIYVTTDGYLWLECFADDQEAEHGAVITELDAGDHWDDLVAKVQAHIAEHGCGPAEHEGSAHA